MDDVAPSCQFKLLLDFLVPVKRLETEIRNYLPHRHNENANCIDCFQRVILDAYCRVFLYW